ncbi:hypothetical protein CBS101457_001476 [Exobasidium rhododendri]|nr:hypothetical protein CBS101457_001476 [Exobasidium rhododendri]
MILAVGARTAKTISEATVRRCFSTTSRRDATRYYRYVIDVHGQLFLHDTTPKNLTSCFKNPQFLDFFFTRIKPNVGKVNGKSSSSAESASIKKKGAESEEEQHWTEREGLHFDEASRIAYSENYRWVSPCQGESNFIRASKSPIVFRELDQDGMLHWAGTFTCKFEPSSLRVDSETGYVYHPSPIPPLRSIQKKIEAEGPTANPYGAYSLLSSALVLQRLATGLDVDPDAFVDGEGGSIEWDCQRWRIGIIQKDDLG